MFKITVNSEEKYISYSSGRWFKKTKRSCWKGPFAKMIVLPKQGKTQSRPRKKSKIIEETIIRIASETTTNVNDSPEDTAHPTSSGRIFPKNSEKFERVAYINR